MAAALPFLSLANFLGFGEAPRLPKAAESAVVVIRTPSGGGSGFLASLDGKTYIVTNQHVLMGTAAADVQITFIDGTKAYPTKPEIVGDQDLARIEIATTREPLKCAAGTPEVGAPVLAVGNSLDAGVITVGPGRVKGVGPQEIEVDCDFVPGNSGGPILDASGGVLGVATYIRFGQADAATAGTRYAKNRRFAVRLRDGMKWIPIPQWPVYAAAGAKILDAGRLGEEAYLAAQAIAANADPTLFKPRSTKVASAMEDLGRLRDQLGKIAGGGVTAQELRSNQSTLTATYRSSLQKLREACAASAREMNAAPLSPEWAWLNGQRKEAAESLQVLQALFEAELKKPSPFQAN